MGAFHEGHLHLMRRAREATDQVVVSLFVNPTQFGKGEDFERYPRDLERDASLAQNAGVDILFAPEVTEIYPRSVATTVHVPEVTERWEGASRPGHFDGVSTVVAKLFHIVQPRLAFFGQKDLQQCLVIRRMVLDLNMPVGLRFVPTTRELDGLAMSSRNVYLSVEERRVAPRLHETLMRLKEAIGTKDSNTPDCTHQLEQERAYLSSNGFLLDYLEYVSGDTMEPIRIPKPDSALIVAARLGKTRLIDNEILSDFLNA